MSISKSSIVEDFLKYEHIPYEIVTDVQLLMKVSHGTLNPASTVGFKPKGYDVILIDIYQAIDWIRSVGLVRV